MTRRDLHIGHRQGRDRPHAVEQFGAGNERDAEAGEGQQDAAIAGIVLHVMNAALDRSDRDRVGDEKRLQTRLDDK